MSKPKKSEGYTRKDRPDGVDFSLFFALLLLTSCIFLQCSSKNVINKEESIDKPVVINSRESLSIAKSLEYSGEFSSDGTGIEEIGPVHIKSSKGFLATHGTIDDSLLFYSNDRVDPREGLLSQVKKGVISTSVPTTMIEGKSYIAHLRVDDKVSPSLTEGLANPEVASVEVSATMKATLTAGKNIEIDSSYSSSTQLRKIGKPTEWKWGLRPVKSGKHKLKLRIICVLKRKGFTDETYDLKTYEKELFVQVDPWYRIKNILRRYWAVIGGMLFSSSAVGWLFRKILKKYKKPR